MFDFKGYLKDIADQLCVLFVFFLFFFSPNFDDCEKMNPRRYKQGTKKQKQTENKKQKKSERKTESTAAKHTKKIDYKRPSSSGGRVG